MFATVLFVALFLGKGAIELYYFITSTILLGYTYHR